MKPQKHCELRGRIPALRARKSQQSYATDRFAYRFDTENDQSIELIEGFKEVTLASERFPIRIRTARCFPLQMAELENSAARMTNKAVVCAETEWLPSCTDPVHSVRHAVPTTFLREIAHAVPRVQAARQQYRR
jgi:hypothetical protein